MFGNDPTDSDFVSPDRILLVDAQSRYEFLLRVIRHLLARGVSFTSIEESLVAAGIAPDSAEQIVELVLQDVQGRTRSPGGFPHADVTPAVLEALGFPVTGTGVQLPADVPLEAVGAGAVQELAFAQPTDAVAARVASASSAHQTFVVGVLVLVALLGAGALLFFLFAVL